MASRRGWAPLAVLTAGVLSVGPVRTNAQTSTVVCLSSFDWMFNSLQQSPCVVSAYLQAACDGGQFTYNPLPDGYHYIGPQVTQQNQCQCSTITYNTVSACGLCQNHTIIGWDVWSYNCTTVYPNLLPQGVPGTTAVPQWAFQNVTSTNMFDVSLAQSVGDSPESTLIRAQSTGSTVSTSTGVSVVQTSISTTGTSTPSPTSGSKTNTAAIAGGVVGGVVGAALIAGVAVYFIMKKRRSRVPPSAQYAAAMSPSSGFTDTVPFNAQMTQPRLYDPSDPSTFPPSSASTLPSSGRYSGAPQL